jgi:ligand-binding sensor domain-containing protein/two-component sensor histidine kinase
MIIRIFLKTLKIKYFTALLFLFCLCNFSSNLAQEYVFRQIRIEHGLSQSTVYCIIQDKKGFLWFGTANGLNRYDGYNFQIFSNDPLDTNSLSDNGIVSLCEDNEGFIWIGTVEGVLNRFNRKTGTFKRFYITENLNVNEKPNEKYFDFPLPFSRNSDRSITSIAEGPSDNLWIGTWGKGLIKFNKKNFKTESFSYHSPNSNNFNSNRVKAIVVDQNTVWVGTIGAGLYKISRFEQNYLFGNHTFSKSNSKSISDNQIVSLYKDRLGDLWIGTYNGGLNYLSKKNQALHPKNSEFVRYQNQASDSKSLSGNFVTSIIEDNRGNIWVGTFGGGINKLDLHTKTFTRFVHDPNITNSISKNDILSMYEDQSGIIWIGSHLGKGLNKLERTTEKFKQVNKSFNNNNGLNDDVVWALYEDENSELWIGTYKGGLNKWDRKKSTFTYFKNNTEFNHIRVIREDENGNLLIGTYSGGLFVFNKNFGIINNYKNNSADSLSLGADQVQSILIDSNNEIWIGTFGGGLNKIRKNKSSYSNVSFIKYLNNPQDPFSLSDNRIYTIFEDKDKILWIGTFGGGLNKFDRNTEHFISYKNIVGDETSLSDNRIMSIYEDSKGMLWIGTYGGGLLKFNKRTEKFTRYNKKNRLNSSVVYGILDDNSGNIWMSTDNGLFKMNIETENITQYDLHDGLQSLEFSGGAYFKSKSGEMFFGGINGLNHFFPNSVKDNYFIPQVVISSIRIFNKLIKGDSDTIDVQYNENLISIEFAALDFTNPPDNQYAYYLEGFDESWHYVDSRRRIANYTNLSPGEYIFYIRGSNNDGVWNNIGTKLFIIIAPPFWQTWWFITLFVMAVAFIIYYLSTMRFRNLLTIEKIKSKLSADLHDNIGSGLTEISILSELASSELKSMSESSSAKLKSISDKARTLIDNMSDIVWMVNPQRDSLYHLILRLKDTYSDIFHSLGISFGTINLEKFAAIKLPMDYKQNLFLIFKEAVNNSIKHSKCKKITLEANLNKDFLELSLTDDGIGMDLEKIKYGNGILNMKSRARVLNGDLQIISLPQRTTIIFTGRINNKSNQKF